MRHTPPTTVCLLLPMQIAHRDQPAVGQWRDAHISKADGLHCSRDILLGLQFQINSFDRFFCFLLPLFPFHRFSVFSSTRFDFIAFLICCQHPVIQYLSLSSILRCYFWSSMSAILCWLTIMKLVIGVFYGSMTGFLIW